MTFCNSNYMEHVKIKSKGSADAGNIIAENAGKTQQVSRCPKEEKRDQCFRSKDLPWNM